MNSPDRSPLVQAFMDLPAPTAPRGGVQYDRRPSPYELAREQHAAQLVDDVVDVLLAYDDSLDPRWAGGAAAAVVRLVYPTLQQVIDRDTPEDLERDAVRLLNGAVDDDGDGRVQLVAGLLRDLRRLYDDAQNVRDSYGDETRRMEQERNEAQHDLAELREAVRRIRRIVRPFRTGRG